MSKSRFILFILLLSLSYAGIGQVTATQHVFEPSTDSLTIRQHIDKLERTENIVLSFNGRGLNLAKVKVFSNQSITVSEFIITLFEEYEYRVISSSIDKVLIVFEGIEEVNNTLTVRGKVYDRVTKEVLVSATIYDEISKVSTFTNEHGFFSIKVVKNNNRLLANYIGYQQSNKQNVANSALDFFMEYDNLVDTFTISTNISDGIIKGSGSEKIDQERLQTIRGVTGEPDVLDATRILPGVNAGNEGQTGFYVRGGSPDQNLILLDGIPMYEVSHTVGLSSIFIDESIKEVDFMKNGFPARYGGRLSSVMSIRLKEGNKSDFQGTAATGLTSVKAQVEGPIIKGQTSFNISGRKSFLNLYLNDLYTTFTEYDNIGVDYYDFTAKLSHNFSPTRKLTLSFYQGNDDFELDREENFIEAVDSFEANSSNRIRWGSRVFNAQFTNVLTDNLFMSATLGGNLYSFDANNEYQFQSTIDEIQTNLDYSLKTNTEIIDYIASLNFDYFVNEKHIVKFGGVFNVHNYQPELKQSNTKIGEEEKPINIEERIIPADEYGLYIEDTYTVSKHVQMYFGLHYSGFSLSSGGRYNNLQPRFNMIIKPSDKSRIDFAYTNTAQYIHLLVNPGIGLPSDLWVPSTSDIKPETADQVSLSYSQSVGDHLKFRVGGYYKSLNNVLEYRSPVDFIFNVLNPSIEIDTSGWEERVEVGESSSQGLEFQVDYTTSQWSVWTAYTYSKTDRVFENVNDGNAFPYKYDRRHDFKAGVSYKFNDKLTLSGRWSFGNGSKFSLGTVEFEGIGGVKIINPGQRNNYSMPDFHHLDIQLQYVKRFTEKQKLQVNFGLYNMYNRRNGFFIYIFENPLNGDKNLRKVSLFPVLPNLNISYSF